MTSTNTNKRTRRNTHHQAIMHTQAHARTQSHTHTHDGLHARTTAAVVPDSSAEPRGSSLLFSASNAESVVRNALYSARLRVNVCVCVTSSDTEHTSYTTQPHAVLNCVLATLSQAVDVSLHCKLDYNTLKFDNTTDLRRYKHN